MFDRGFTGHEHLYAFSLINMNGRMYDPLLSSFLSPDNYMQDPTSQQGFNRYAYCMYNPLKYVDPTGERPLGWSGGSTYYFESNRSYVIQEMYNLYMLGIESHWNIVNLMTNSIYTQGAYIGGRHGGSGNHGSPGGDGKTTKPKNYDDKQLWKGLRARRGKCVFGALGCMSTCWGDGIIGETTREWRKKERDYFKQHNRDKHGYDANSLIDFITWNPDGKYNNYIVERINVDQIYNSMEEGWVVATMCTLSNYMIDLKGFNNGGHYVNINSCTMYNDGSIYIDFHDIQCNTFMTPYYSTQTDFFELYMYTIPDKNNPQNMNQILENIGLIRIKLIP